MTSKSENNRTILGFFNLSKLQFRFSIMIGGTALVVCILYSLIMYFYMKENYEILVVLSPMDESVKSILNNELRKTWIYMIFTSLLFSFLSFVWGGFFSHKLTGPIFNISKVIDDVLIGKLNSRIKLRPSDELQELSNKINILIKNYEENKG